MTGAVCLQKFRLYLGQWGSADWCATNEPPFYLLIVTKKKVQCTFTAVFTVVKHHILYMYIVFLGFLENVVKYHKIYNYC